MAVDVNVNVIYITNTAILGLPIASQGFTGVMNIRRYLAADSKCEQKIDREEQR